MIVALSTCTKCNATRFEIKENSPTGSNFKFHFVQCSHCGNVVGVMDFFNTGARLEDLEKKIDDHFSGTGNNLNTIRYLRRHHKQYGIDPNKIGTLGFSAGGGQ